MKTTEQIRFEAYWYDHLPEWFLEVVPFEALFTTDEEHDYQNEFAQTAWGAWNAAQYSTVKVPAKKKGVHKKPHPWRKTEEPKQKPVGEME